MENKSLHRPEEKNSESAMNLPITIGLKSNGENRYLDLSKSYHLLIAGAPGQGKTTLIKSIITSLVNDKTSSELKLALIDPKRCQLTDLIFLDDYLISFENQPGRVATETDSACELLENLCSEMERRLEMMKRSGISDLQILRTLSGEALPYIVCVLDEYADLVIQEPKAMKLILNLARKGHVAGINLILSTSRVISSVITGAIKANFPSRVSFRLFTSRDSKLVLNIPGAELLSKQGEMIFCDNKGNIDNLTCVVSTDTKMATE